MRRFLIIPIIFTIFFAFHFVASAASLNFKQAGDNASQLSILLDTTKRTTPALASGIRNADGSMTIYYANMEPASATRTLGNLYVSYDGGVYEIQNNTSGPMTYTPEFWVTTTNDTSEFTLSIGASGIFTIDWGDGIVETFEHDSTVSQLHSHTYTAPGEYTIGLGGRATAYGITDVFEGELSTALAFMDMIEGSFSSSDHVASISGSLGNIFPTIDNGGDGKNPVYYGTFAMMSNITGGIPAGLFGNVHGQPSTAMFASTFMYSPFTGQIPAGLFGKLSGTPAPFMFASTFAGGEDCDSESLCKLTGEIPVGLFGNLYGAPTDYMFAATFAGCHGLYGPTARMTNGTRLYDVAYDGQTWANLTGGENGSSFYIMYACTNVYDSCAGATFCITTTDNTQKFSFNMSAMGEFDIDWGDGQTQHIVRNDTNVETYNHTYNASGKYMISFEGSATGYSTDSKTAAISFYQSENVADIGGSLGTIFHTIGDGNADGSQPRFYMTFAGLLEYVNSKIPEKLFDGVVGQPVSNMFAGTFSYSLFTGEIPSGLFSGIKGNPADGMFMNTFAITGLTGNIPANLFAGIKGAPAPNMFKETFVYGQYTGSIPAELFSGISGAPAGGMFGGTFAGCSGLTGRIPAGLFSGISGTPANNMFSSTFSDCNGLTGNIPDNLFGNIYGAPAGSMFYNTFYGCSSLKGNIPNNLFGNLSGAPADNMFHATFSGCSGLTGNIPDNLFGNIYGDAAGYMVYHTFYGCSGLTGPSARINGEYLYNIWPDYSIMYNGCYSGATGLSDYNEMPDGWK